MQFTDEEILINPGYCARTWQSCDYSAKGVHLFHHRTGMRTLPKVRDLIPASVYWLVSGEDWEACWLPITMSQAEINKLAEKWGGKAVHEFYADENEDAYFLSFDNVDKALAFCRSDDFDKHALSMEKRD